MIKLVIKPLTLLMMAMPFVSMIVILSALWGIIGKTTYIDLRNPTLKNDSDSASNVLVKQTENGEACNKSVTPNSAFEGEDNETSKNKTYRGKIDWDKVV